MNYQILDHLMLPLIQNNWNYINQPIDQKPDIGVYTYASWGNQDSVAFKAITTDIYNISYDLDIMGDYIYASSFAGGIRRFNYTLDEPEWELVPLPMDSQSSFSYKRSIAINHKCCRKT